MNREIAKIIASEHDLYVREYQLYKEEQNVNLFDKDTPFIIKLLEKSHRLIKPFDIEIRLTFPPILEPSPADKLICIQPWEMIEIPLEWMEFWNTYATALIGISSWNEQLYKSKLTNKNLLIGHINPVLNDIWFKQEKKLNSRQFTFLFDGGGNFRKGADIVLDAFFKTFNGNRFIKLIFKDSKIYRNDLDLFNTIKKLNINCDYYNSTLSFEELKTLYRSADAILYPSRGEGFGFCPAQGLACGLPIVAPLHTGLSDILQFADEYKINCQETRIPTNYFFDTSKVTIPSEVNVAEPILNHTQFRMMELLANKEKYSDPSLAFKFHSSVIAEHWLELIETVSSL
jgi:glycosyltransferase involved in cell wall biosynthesis